MKQDFRTRSFNLASSYPWCKLYYNMGYISLLLTCYLTILSFFSTGEIVLLDDGSGGTSNHFTSDAPVTIGNSESSNTVTDSQYQEHIAQAQEAQDIEQKAWSAHDRMELAKVNGDSQQVEQERVIMRACVEEYASMGLFIEELPDPEK